MTVGKASTLSPLTPPTPLHSPESTPKHTQDLDGKSVCAWGWGQSGKQSEELHGAEVTEKLVMLVPTLDAQDGKQVCRERGLSTVSASFGLRCMTIRQRQMGIHTQNYRQRSKHKQRCFCLPSQWFPNMAKLWDHLEVLRVLIPGSHLQGL